MFEKFAKDVVIRCVEKLAALGDNYIPNFDNLRNLNSRYIPKSDEFKEVENPEEFIPPEMTKRPYDYSPGYGDPPDINKKPENMTPYERAVATAFEDKYFSPMTSADAIPYVNAKDYSYSRGFAGEKVGIPENIANTALQSAAGFDIPKAKRDSWDSIYGRKNTPILEALLDLKDEDEGESDSETDDTEYSENPYNPYVLLKNKPKYKQQSGEETYVTFYPYLRSANTTGFGHYKDGEENVRQNYINYRNGALSRKYDINQLIREAYGFTQKE